MGERRRKKNPLAHTKPLTQRARWLHNAGHISDASCVRNLYIQQTWVRKNWFIVNRPKSFYRDFKCVNCCANCRYTQQSRRSLFILYTSSSYAFASNPMQVRLCWRTNRILLIIHIVCATSTSPHPELGYSPIRFEAQSGSATESYSRGRHATECALLDRADCAGCCAHTIFTLQ